MLVAVHLEKRQSAVFFGELLKDWTDGFTRAAPGGKIIHTD
jgi:hypothetical protein